ncbi:DUF2938 family protein [Acinetobacter sp. HY1485]|uniref:DUF2938 family protein n=1 Tax=Acinetobacter sp. HY1485 TaxID=2970918 RepID=UPI0022B94A3A|nr:DUF2938 family protein [Acinetobacter sp. HY1485]
MHLFLYSIWIGILATAVMDFIAWLRATFFNTKSLNYALIGRWILSFKDGRWVHNTILTTSPKYGETWFGWAVHYLIGILFSYVYLQLNLYFAFQYTILNILGFASLTTLIPFLMMQPALGFGFFACKTPKPLNSILNSLIAHLAFGFGLYIAVSCLVFIYRS